MKISLFQGILMGVFCLGALIGLFVFSTYKGDSAASAVGSVTIWGTLPAASVQLTLTTLGQTTAEFKNVTYSEKRSATLGTDLAAAIATGVAPDLVLASQEELKALIKFIEPIPFSSISAASFQNTFVGAADIFAAPSGHYGLPFLVDPIVLYSNQSILSSNGIARPPATWEALAGLVPSVAVLTPSRQITRALIALGTYTNIHNAHAILSTLFLQVGIPLSTRSSVGGITADLGARMLEGVPRGEAVLGFYTQFADPTKVSYTWNASLPNSEQSFLSGDLTLHLDYASRARVLRTTNPNLDFTVSAVPQPATANVKRVYGLVYAFMIPRAQVNRTGAFTVATLFTGSDAQRIASAVTGLAPSTLTELSVAQNDPTAAVVNSEALYTSAWLSPAPERVDQVFSSMIGNVMSGRFSIPVALSTAEQSLNAALQQ
ncbi:MAG: extracellular solute-binding protein [Patescibacteria group bacterium]